MPILLIATSQHLQWCLQVHKCLKECMKKNACFPHRALLHQLPCSLSTGPQLGVFSDKTLAKGAPRSVCHDQAGQVLQGPSICYERGRGAWRPIRQWQNLFPPHPVTPRKQREQRVMKIPSSQKGQGSNPGGCFLICVHGP